ncbi:MAG: L-2-hydroxyglutarate oxidase, partial [Cyanobacteria bacterium J06641_5]
LRYADIIRLRGGDLFLSTKVEQIVKTSSRWVVETNNGSYSSQYIINCAGLQSDRIAKLSGATPKAKIVPFRGEYYELKPEKRYFVKSLIYPVPNPNFPFLGVHFTKGIDGGVHAGPNAALSFKREGYHKWDFDAKDLGEVLAYPGFWKLALKYADIGIGEMVRSWSKAAFVRSLQRLIPEVRADDLIPCEAGVRAQALMPTGQLVDDFLLLEEQDALHVCNAPSPAATSSLEIGRAVAARVPMPSRLQPSI